MWNTNSLSCRVVIDYFQEPRSSPLDIHLYLQTEMMIMRRDILVWWQMARFSPILFPRRSSADYSIGGVGFPRKMWHLLHLVCCGWIRDCVHSGSMLSWKDKNLMPIQLRYLYQVPENSKHFPKRMKKHCILEKRRGWQWGRITRGVQL